MGVTYATNSDLVFATRDGATSVTEKMRILGNGDVGIGTASPAQALQIVQGKSMMLGDYFFLGSGDSNYMGSIGFNRDTTNGNIFNSSYGAYQIHNYQGTLKLQVYSAAGGTIGEHKFYNDASIRFKSSVEFSDGVVRLINNQLQSGFNSNSEDNDFWINYTGYQGGTTRYRDFRIGNGKQGQIAFFDGSTGYSTFNGNVGIGTTGPSKKLEVAGSFKLGTNAYIEYGASYPYTITTANTAAVGNLVFSAGLGSNAYESRIDLQGTNTAGAAGITFSTAATARMSITSAGLVEIKSNSTTQASFEQTLAIAKQLGNSGVAIPVAYVDHTHSLDVTVIVKQDTSNVSVGKGSSVVAYGSGSASLSTVRGSGNVSSVSIAYLNTNPNGQNYVLTVTPTFNAGNPPIAYVTIRGNSTSAISEY